MTRHVRIGREIGRVGLVGKPLKGACMVSLHEGDSWPPEELKWAQTDHTRLVFSSLYNYHYLKEL